LALFDIPDRIMTPSQDKLLLERLRIKKSSSKSKGLIDIINEIIQDVETNLGEYKQQFKVLTTKEEVEEYICKANANGVIAIDSETTGLNPLTAKIVGLCLYTPNEKPVYVPINHLDYISLERLNNQISETEIKNILDKLTAKVIMFNAAFDVRVLRHTLNVYLKCWWDCAIAARLMNENEKTNKLKPLHSKYVLNGNKDAKSFNELFTISFDLIPIQYAYLYAANDALITYQLYEFQAKYLNPNSRPDLADIYHLFMDIEMPVVEVVCNMEDTGVQIDEEYIHNYLMPKYHKLQEDCLAECYKELLPYQEKIDIMRKRNPHWKLSNPINLKSTSQMEILLYKILEYTPPETQDDKVKVDEAALSSIDTPFTRAVLKYRSVEKLLSTYIDNIPDILINGRIHCNYNQLGAKTGRFSSNNPNLQNIPSRNKDIRKMFIGGLDYREVDSTDGVYSFDKTEEIQLVNGEWVFVENIKQGDITEDGVVTSVKIEDGKKGKVYIKINIDS